MTDTELLDALEKLPAQIRLSNKGGGSGFWWFYIVPTEEDKQGKDIIIQGLNLRDAIEKGLAEYANAPTTVKKWFIYHDYLDDEELEEQDPRSVQEIHLLVKEDGLYHPYSGIKVEKGWYFDTSGEAMEALRNKPWVPPSKRKKHG